MKTTNPTHEYALSLLAFTVEEPINGRTDSYTVAAFESVSEAEKYAAYRNAQEPDHDYGYEVREVGTLRNLA